ncbi:helix-turn-helix transcriptional regulator [Phaeobacter gallaeciensis]|uniref:helix-turn-helix transcriptional regulator n=1 Tax=Phaeobacter gallaeciensis TaxID=60890 RepID=UPI000BC0BEBE|nr:LuxR C-terminal-related transcriptional regulator [Phaeobacter gallaeciensis]ATF18855.1 transcriptional regulator, LuxR family [Phaeobacter gallaeciensis]ATF22964.1 transcriptional regulator, LuxR family [Phaeobacter gallaeciensis]
MFQSLERIFVSLALLILLVFTLGDTVVDAQNGDSPIMLFVDLLGFLLQTIPLLYIWYFQPITAWRASYRLAAQAKRKSADVRYWSDIARKQLNGLSIHIDAQFEQWSLTPAETDVALLLLKGFSMREIADLRHISERTARQQATTVYAKADVNGRTALSAFFLEDLLPPNRQGSRATRDGDAELMTKTGDTNDRLQPANS